MRLATEDETPAENAADAPESDDALELGGEDAPKVEDAENASDDEGKKKTRSQRWEKRVDALTARLREAEARALAAEQKAGTSPPTEANDAAPDPDQYDFGEADPKYLTDLARHEARSIILEERRKADEQAKKSAEQNAVFSKLNEGMANVEKQGTEKYDDFEAKIKEAVDERGPLSQPLSIAVAVSPAGADVAYKLATNDELTDRLEGLAKTDIKAAALAFGEVEGEFIDDDSDLDLNDPLDMARMLGRMKYRVANGGTKAAKETTERRTSKAPPPPETQARGNTGRFEVDDSTEDFRAFEAKYSKK
jgi:hypothetical protein